MPKDEDASCRQCTGAGVAQVVGATSSKACTGGATTVMANTTGNYNLSTGQDCHHTVTPAEIQTTDAAVENAAELLRMATTGLVATDTTLADMDAIHDATSAAEWLGRAAMKLAVQLERQGDGAAANSNMAVKRELEEDFGRVQSDGGRFAHSADKNTSQGRLMKPPTGKIANAAKQETAIFRNKHPTSDTDATGNFAAGHNHPTSVSGSRGGSGESVGDSLSAHIEEAAQSLGTKELAVQQNDHGEQVGHGQDRQGEYGNSNESTDHPDANRGGGAGVKENIIWLVPLQKPLAQQLLDDQATRGLAKEGNDGGKSSGVVTANALIQSAGKGMDGAIVASIRQRYRKCEWKISGILDSRSAIGKISSPTEFDWMDSMELDILCQLLKERPERIKAIVPTFRYGNNSEFLSSFVFAAALAGCVGERQRSRTDWDYKERELRAVAMVMQHIPPLLWNTGNAFALSVVKMDGRMLCYLPQEHSHDREVALAAIEQAGTSRIYNSQRLWEDRLFIIGMIKLSMRNPSIEVRDCFIRGHFLGDAELMLLNTQRTGMMGRASKNLRNDPGWMGDVLQHVRNARPTIELLSPELKGRFEGAVEGLRWLERCGRKKVCLGDMVCVREAVVALERTAIERFWLLRKAFEEASYAVDSIWCFSGARDSLEQTEYSDNLLYCAPLLIALHSRGIHWSEASEWLDCE